MTNYIYYSNKEDVARLDLNLLRAPNVVVFPRSIYSGDLLPAHNTTAMTVEDLESNYIYRKERFDHPDHFSTFRYDNCEFGYCSGHVPGKFETSPPCHSQILPPGVAPDRFYSLPYSAPCRPTTPCEYESSPYCLK